MKPMIFTNLQGETLDRFSQGSFTLSISVSVNLPFTLGNGCGTYFHASWLVERRGAKVPFLQAGVFGPQVCRDGAIPGIPAVPTLYRTGG